MSSIQFENIHSNLNVISAFNWLQATETNDLQWLVKDIEKPFKPDELKEAFKVMNGQLIDVLGISDDYLNYLHKRRAYNIALGQYILTKDNFDFTMMKVAEADLEQSQKRFSTKKKTFSDKINAERLLGFRMPLRDISAVEYYTYIKEADKIARSLSAKKS